MFLYYYIKKLLSNFCCWCLPNEDLEDKRFYYLSLMENTDNSNGYNIHGLWPQYDLNHYPQYCKNVIFTMRVLKPIKKDLLKYWKPKKLKDPISFWVHEWKKHGSCMFSEITQYEYFKITLDLYKEVIDKNLICEKYKSGYHYLIPVDLNFKLMI